MTNYLRPDEKAVESDIKRSQKRTGEAKYGLQTALSLGSSALGASVASKVMPFISQYIPEDLALKGISKVAPSVGDFLKNGVKQGLSLKSGLDFLKNQVSNSSQQELAKEERNIIQQYSPELHQFIDQEVKKGRSSIEAAALAQNDKKFRDIITKLTKDHKAPWSSIVESIYGGQGQAQPQQAAPPQQAQSGQGGQGQQALMAILQKLNQSRGGGNAP